MVMLYLVFSTEAQALRKERDIFRAINVVPVNAETGLPDHEAQHTERWAVPKQTLLGTWVIPSPDETGVADAPEWWPPPVGPFG